MSFSGRSIAGQAESRGPVRRELILANCELACQPTAVPRARNWLARTLEPHVRTQADRSVVDDATLCVSELVTNALLAGCSGISLCVDLDGGRLRISVHDDASGIPTVRDPGWSDPHGRGLLIVSAVATTWGVRPVDAGKEVWADLPWPA